MRARKFSVFILLAAGLFLTSACFGGTTDEKVSSAIVLVGSTPGDPSITARLGIDDEKQIDFIRWHLCLSSESGGRKTFHLNIVYGEGAPNTTGFMGGGDRRSYHGVYEIRKSGRGEIYDLKIEKPSGVVSLVRLSEDLFHLLSSDQRLMVGNGGWSYTLSRADSSADGATAPASSTFARFDEPTPEMIFDGRTPCAPFARHFKVSVAGDCFKLKWRLSLFSNQHTHEPAGYKLEGTLYRRNAVEGKWRVIRGLPGNSGAVVYQLDPDRPDRSVSFLAGDENVLFFLDRESRLLTGNSGYSFTLNRRRE